MSETPLATYRVWRSQILELTRQQPRTGGIAELLHWFGRASLNPMTGKRHSLRGADLHSWYVRSWRRPRYLLTPHMTHLSVRAAQESGAFVRIRVLPFAAARPLVGVARGSGADVLAYTGPPAPATVTVTNAAIWFAGPDGTDFRLLMKHDGPYQGRVQLPGGPGLLAIETPRPWSTEL
jgi:hypothetical protein